MLSRAGFPGAVGRAGRTLSPYDGASSALFARMTSQPTDARKLQIDTLIRAIKAAGVWDKLDVLHILAAHDAQAARLNWKGATNEATDVGTPTFTADRGFATNGSTSAVAWGINQNGGTQFTQNSAYFAVWCRTATAYTNPAFGTATGTNVSLTTRATTTNIIQARLNGASRMDTVATVATGAGLTSLNRLSSSSAQVRKNGVQVNSNFTNTSASLGAVALNSGRCNSAFVAVDVAAHVLGSQFSDAEDAAFYAALNTYMTAVGAA